MPIYDNIVFSEDAQKNFDAVILNIKHRFGAKVAERVMNDIFEVIHHAKIYPQLGKTYRDDIRFLIVRKRTIMFYKSNGKSMIIINFFDTRQNWMLLL